MLAIDRRIVYVILLLVIAWPTISPWGLPIVVGREVRGFHTTLEAVPAGGTIALAIDYRSDFITELNPMTTTIFTNAMKRNLKVIMWAGVDEGANLSQNICAPIAAAMGKTYGVDWINLGYKPLSDVLLNKMVTDFWDAVAFTEIQGKHVEQFPIMAGFRSLGDADLLVNVCGVTPGSHRYIQMVTIPTGISMVAAITSVDIAMQMPYFASGQFKGILGGLRGAAEYEFLSGMPGPAIAGMDAQSAAHVLIILLIILGNVGFLLTRKPGAKVAASGGDLI
jgi:hypothetical protein